MPAVSKTIGTSPTLLTPARVAGVRQWVRIDLPRSASADVFIGIGDPAVTVNTGVKLNRGFARYIENDTLAKPAANAIYGVVASGTAVVTVDEGN